MSSCKTCNHCQPCVEMIDGKLAISRSQVICTSEKHIALAVEKLDIKNSNPNKLIIDFTNKDGNIASDINTENECQFYSSDKK